MSYGMDSHVNNVNKFYCHQDRIVLFRLNTPHWQYNTIPIKFGFNYIECNVSVADVMNIIENILFCVCVNAIYKETCKHHNSDNKFR